jgi:hypothetical protein
VPQESLIHGRSFFISTNGFMGLVPEKAAPGDEICLFFGGAPPVVLQRRSNREGDIYGFVGECYVYGLVNGEALDGVPLQLIQDFVLE